ELQVAGLANAKILEQAEVPLLKSGADQNVAATVSEDAGRHKRRVQKRFSCEPVCGSTASTGQVWISGHSSARGAGADSCNVCGYVHRVWSAALELRHAGHFPPTERCAGQRISTL